MELVDVVDSKSTAGDSVPVRVRSPAPHSHPDFDRVGVGFFFLIFDEFPIFPVFLEQIWSVCFLSYKRAAEILVFAERFRFTPFTE